MYIKLKNNKAVFGVILFLLAFMVALQPVGAKRGKNTGAKLKLDTAKVHLDTTYTDNPYKTFYIGYTNVGDKNLLIKRVEPACPCTTVEFDSLPLRKNKRGEMKVTVNLSHYSKGQYISEIYIYTNAADSVSEVMFWGHYFEKEN